MKHFDLKNAQWPQDAEQVHAIRQQVFVVEQGIDPALEWTGDADQFRSILAFDADQNPIGTGRVKVAAATATIGRMAVLKDWRRAGVGTAILSRLIEIGKADGADKFELSAQVSAIDFYQKLGFIASGDVYLDADIKHRKMTLTIV